MGLIVLSFLKFAITVHLLCLPKITLDFFNLWQLGSVAEADQRDRTSNPMVSSQYL